MSCWVELRDDLRVGQGSDGAHRANRRYLQAYRDNSRLLRVIEQAAVTNPPNWVIGDVPPALPRTVTQLCAGCRSRAGHDRPSPRTSRPRLCARWLKVSRYWQRP